MDFRNARRMWLEDPLRCSVFISTQETHLHHKSVYIAAAYMGGTISLIVILWDAMVTPIIGYIADRTTSKYGRRRPFMLAAVFPLLLFTVLLFTAVNFSTTASYAYYIIIGILFWTVYDFYVVPFSALGAELTQNFNDRNNLRTVVGFFIYLTVWGVTALPMFIWDRVSLAGGSDQLAWIISALVIGGAGLICGLICWNFTRGKELSAGSTLVKDANTQIERGFLRNYIELLKQRPLRNITLTMICLCISFSIESAALVYLMNNNLGLSETTQAFYWTCYTVITFIVLPICNVIANKIGKRNALLLLNALAAGGCVLYYVVGIDSFVQLVIFSFLYQLGNSALWILGYSLSYDCIEVDEFLHGCRREGAVTGLTSFTQKLGSALGMWISGLLLSFFNYDGTQAVQSTATEKGILFLNTIAPAISILFGIVFLWLYPINQKNYQAILEATEQKKTGQPFSVEKFKELIK
ncbi:MULTISPECIES: MFS transporter [Anaerovoracaceae]